MKVQDSCQTQQNAEKVLSVLFSALVIHTPMRREKNRPQNLKAGLGTEPGSPLQ